MLQFGNERGSEKRGAVFPSSHSFGIRYCQCVQFPRFHRSIYTRLEIYVTFIARSLREGWLGRHSGGRGRLNVTVETEHTGHN